MLISDSSFQGEVTGNNEYIGGLIGRFESVPSVAAVSGMVLAQNSVHATLNNAGGQNYYGGLVGGMSITSSDDSDVDVSFSENSVFVTLLDGGVYLGGLAGNFEINSSSSVAPTVSIANNAIKEGSSISGSLRVGGLIGHMGIGALAATVLVDKNMSAADVSGNIDFVGGIVGYAQTDNIFLSNNVGAGVITGTGDYVSGIVGVAATIVNFDNNWFDKDLNPTVGCTGIGVTPAADYEGQCDAVLESTDLRGSSTNIPYNSWDFEGTWEANAGRLPILQASDDGSSLVVAEFWNLGAPTVEPTFPGDAPDFTTTYDVLDVNYLAASPDASINDDGFTGRFTQTTYFTAGDYLFISDTDDGAKVYFDGTLIINNWIDQDGGETMNSGSIAVTSGLHTLVLDYYENSGDASAHVWYGAYPYSGTGTPEDPIVISSCLGLQALDDINTNHAGSIYSLEDDIDCSESTSWYNNGLGGYYGFNPITSFNATFLGNGHSITDLYVNHPSAYQPQALIGYATNAGIVDLHLVGGSIEGSYDTASFVGYSNNSTLTGVSSNLSLTGNSDNVGGLVGYAVNGTTVTQSSFTGSIDGTIYLGGLIGWVDTASSTDPISIDNSFANADITGDQYLGGMVGHVEGVTGGLSIDHSYAAGTLTGSSAAGFIGEFIDLTGTATIDNSFSANSLDTDVGGGVVAMYFNSNALVVTNTYFDTNTMLTSDCVGAFMGEGDSANTTGCLTYDSGATPSYLKGFVGDDDDADEPLVTGEWDFTNIWEYTIAYPTLRTITGLGLPTAPTNLDGTYASGPTLRLSWAAPTDDGGFDIDTYQVEVKLNAQDWEDAFYVEDVTPSQISRLDITEGISTGVLYNFRIRAHNDLGLGLAATGSETVYSVSNGGVGGSGRNTTISEETSSSTTVAPFPFTDVPDDYFGKPYIQTLYDLGVVEGRSETTFEPNGFTTRAEVTKVALLTFNLPVGTNLDSLENYSDVDASGWFARYIATATRLGLIEGYGDQTFRPDDFVTRAEALKIFLSAANASVTSASGTNPFADVPSDSWFANYVLFAKLNDIVNGRSSTEFEPNSLITRGEMAKIAVLCSEL